MNRFPSPALFGLAVLTASVLLVSPVAAQRSQSREGQRAPVRSAEQWVRQLENELDHLEEDIYYDRGSYPEGLAEQVAQASRAAAHFRQVLRRDSTQRHLLRDFQEMDRTIHQLVSRLEESGDGWLRRQASRIRYPDEQLHFVLRRMVDDRAPDDREPVNRELLARHAHLLENEAKNFQALAERVVSRRDPVRRAVGDFAEVAEHFHQVVERGADPRHLRADFRDVEERWQVVVDQINQSDYGLYLRRNAQNVNRVHNQIHELLTAAEPPQREAPPQRDVRRRERPAIEFEIPGLGRFRIPR